MLTKMKIILSDAMAPQLQAWLKDPTADLSEKTILESLESPKDPKMGDLAFPCFSLAKILKKGPPQITQELAKILKLPKGIKSAAAAGGYLNFFFDDLFWTHVVIDEIQNQKEKIGNLNLGAGK